MNSKVNIRLATILIIAAFAAILLISCSEDPKAPEKQEPGGPVCQVIPPTLDFGDVQYGSSSTEVLAITNIGGGTLSGDVGAPPCKGFSLTGGGPFDLQGGETLYVDVRFQPTSFGPRECTIPTGNDGCGDVECTANGTTPPCIWEEMTVTYQIIGLCIWGSSSSNIYMAGCCDTIFHYNGRTFSPAYVNSDLYFTWGMYGTSPTDIFAVGTIGQTVHYNGTGWEFMTSNTDKNLFDVYGGASNSVFAVGDDGVIVYYNGNIWGQMTSGTQDSLRGIWGTSSSDVYVSGFGGTILHYSGSNWSPMNSGTDENLIDIWGSSNTDIFACGGNGTIVHYDGSTWAEMNSSTDLALFAMWGSGPNDVFAVGYNGIIVHYDGVTWSPMYSGTTKVLMAVWGSSPIDVFACGFDNDGVIILHYRPQ